MAGTFPAEILNPDGTIPSENTTAVVAVVKLMEGERIAPGDHQAMLDAGLSEQRIREIQANGLVSRYPAQTPAPSPEDSAQTEARERAAQALQREEQRAKDVRAAKAYLKEKYGETGMNLDNWSEDELLSEAGIQLSEEQKRDAEIERVNEQFRSDPQAAARMLREKEQELFLQEAPSLHPQVRQQRAASYGLTPAEVEEHVAHHWNRRGL